MHIILPVKAKERQTVDHIIYFMVVTRIYLLLQSHVCVGS